MTKKEVLLNQEAYNNVKDNRDKVINDPYRLTYHLMPPVGLLNDPNGLIQYNGVYHVFYQWNPFETAHGAKFWGHYTSKDMVHWVEEPIALTPSDWYDKNGCYSGSAIESDGKLYLFYTGNVKKENGIRESYQCLAVSSDGVHFEKKGPVLELPEQYTAHFRDPKVWKKDERWYMILGAQTLDEKGAAVLFVSNDLYHWEELGKIAGAGMNGIGDFGYMWECPDLIQLSGKDVLLVSPQGIEPNGELYNNLFQSGYFIGKLDYETLHFQHGSFKELDRGFDFYAPQTFTDESGRIILYGWMGMTDDLEPYQPTIANNWVHALTIPRELEFREEKLIQKPVEELKKRRKNQIVIEGNTCHGESAELLIEVLSNGQFEISIRNEAYLSFNGEMLTLKRRNIKTNGLEARSCKIAAVTKLQIFMDHSSLEIFINDGEEVFTTRYFPNPKDKKISIQGEIEYTWTKWDLG